MSNFNPVLHPEFVRLLKRMEAILSQLDIDFYLVGAFARDIHLSGNPEWRPKRKTEDVDFAILISHEDLFYALKETLITSGDFTAHATEPIKFYFEGRIEIDLLPFGTIENTKRETQLNKPMIFTLEMPGFSEAYAAVEEISITEELKIKVCSLEGIVLLKLLSWGKRTERVKDLSDIDHIINVYFSFNDIEIYTQYPEVMDAYSTQANNYLQLVSSRVIGRKVKKMLDNDTLLIERIAAVLQKRPLETWQALLEGLRDA